MLSALKGFPYSRIMQNASVKRDCQVCIGKTHLISKDIHMHLSFKFKTMAGVVVVTRPLMTCSVKEEHMDRLKTLHHCKHWMYSKSFAKQRPQNAAEIKIFT